MSDLLTEEQSFRIGEQWYYRGNVSPQWLFRNDKGGKPGGLATLVPSGIWDILEEVARLRAAQTQLQPLVDALREARTALIQLGDLYCGLNDMTARNAVAAIDKALAAFALVDPP